MKTKRDLSVVFAVAALTSILVAALSGCGHAEQEFRNEFNCHVSGIDCPSVNLDDPNLKGPQGPAGATGPAGSVGPSGAAGTDVRPMQFCPGQPEYPTAFPEIGFCINGNIYAAYSANGGFLTLTPPGRYSSNAVGSRCSFTVHANCVVTP